MSLTINTNIVNDADGHLLDARNVKVGEKSGTKVMLDETLPALYDAPTTIVPMTVISRSAYEALKNAGTVDETVLYLVYEADAVSEEESPT